MGKIIKEWYRQGDRGWKIAFYTAQGISILLILVSFFIPPVAVVDSSVFAATGIIAFYPSLYCFYEIMKTGRKANITKGDLSMSVGEEKSEN